LHPPLPSGLFPPPDHRRDRYSSSLRSPALPPPPPPQEASLGSDESDSAASRPPHPIHPRAPSNQRCTLRRYTPRVGRHIPARLEGRLRPPLPDRLPTRLPHPLGHPCRPRTRRGLHPGRLRPGVPGLAALAPRRTCRSVGPPHRRQPRDLPPA